MLKVSFDSIDQTAITFYNDADAPAAAGGCVVLSGNGTVTPAGEGESFIGVALSAERGFAVVQTRGTVTLPFSGTAPAPGWARLSAAAGGGVAAGESGREFLVLSVGSDELTFIL